MDGDGERAAGAAPGEGELTAEQREALAAAYAERLAERERLQDSREKLRNAEHDRRDRAAERRERVADLRDQRADQREARADERELAALEPEMRGFEPEADPGSRGVDDHLRPDPGEP